MNILYLTQSETIEFGSGAQVYSMALALAQLGHNVKLICKDKKNPGEIVTRVGNGTLSIRKLGGSGGFNTLLFLLKLLLYGSTYIVSSKIDVIYERQSLISVGFLLSKLFRKPMVIGAQDVQYYDYGHGSELVSQIVDSKFLTHRAIYNRLLANRCVMATFRKIAKINYKNATWIITVTSQVKRSICIQYRIDPDKIIVLSNGADVSLFRPMETKTAKKLLALDEGTQYVCFVGTLVFYEGVEYLIKSAPSVLDKCPSAGFLIVGDGPSKGELMNLTQQIGVSAKFIFTGAVPHKDVPMYINASEVCVCIVPDDEIVRKSGASSLKIFEYMACGKSVVTDDKSVSKDVITESNAGIAVCLEHSHELAGAVAKLLKDNQLSQRLGENGRKAVIEKYSWTSIAKRTAEACEEALKRRKGRGAHA